MPLKYTIFAATASVGLALDQASKVWVRATMDLRERHKVIPGFFDLVHAENPGAAWGMFSDAEYRIPFFVLVTLIAIGVILTYVRRLPDDDRLLATAFGLIFAGATGNFIDRIRFQKVTDFFEVYAGGEPARSWLIEHLGSNRWPVFNVADTAICVGVGLFAIHVLFIEPREARAQSARMAGNEGAPSSA